jgi:hypothetical protein
VSELFWSERQRIRSTIEERARLAESVSGMRTLPESGASATSPTLLQLAGITTLGTGSGDRAKPGAPSRLARTWVVAAAVAVVSAAVWGATHTSKKTDARETAVTVTQAVASQPSAPSPAALPSTVKILVRADPESASVLLDGQPFDQSKELERDSSSHRLSISAPGFEPRTIDVVFDGDQSLSVALRPVSPASPTANTASLRTSRSGNAGGRKSTSGAAEKAIDEESPYRR